MILQRYIYAATLVASFIFYLLYSPWFSWYLFVLILLLLPLDLIVSLPGMLTKGILISAPAVLKMNDEAVVKLTTTHTKSFPVRCIISKMQMTGDDFSVSFDVLCPAEKDAQQTVAIDTSQSGVTTYTLLSSSAVSLLGLLSLPIKSGMKQSVLVLPPPVAPSNAMALQQGTHLRPKPGGGFSEEHDMREYRGGDPVKSIHWKVSAKYDSLVIREPLEPPPHSRLVHIMRWNSNLHRDIILGCLRWVTDYLLERQLPFYIRFDDKPQIAEIKQEADMIKFLLTILSDGADKTIIADQIPARFTWVFRIDGGSASQ